MKVVREPLEGSADFSRRFWAKVDRTGACWRWQGACSRGCGMVAIHRTGRARAHRVAWELTVGPIPSEMVVQHTCGERLYVRPDHLELVPVHQRQPRPEQRPRGARHGRATHPERTARGSGNGQATLTENLVRSIRARVAAGESCTAVAADMGVSRSAVSLIVRGRTWRHVDAEPALD